jgi:hypothetical protein
MSFHIVPVPSQDSEIWNLHVQRCGESGHGGGLVKGCCFRSSKFDRGTRRDLGRGFHPGSRLHFQVPGWPSVPGNSSGEPGSSVTPPPPRLNAQRGAGRAGRESECPKPTSWQLNNKLEQQPCLSDRFAIAPDTNDTTLNPTCFGVVCLFEHQSSLQRLVLTPPL